MRKKFLQTPFADEQFGKMFVKATREEDSQKLLERAENLTWYVLEKMGGFAVESLQSED